MAITAAGVLTAATGSPVANVGTATHMITAATSNPTLLIQDDGWKEESDATITRPASEDCGLEGEAVQERTPPMKEADKLYALIKYVKAGDQHPLRQCAKLMRASNLSLAEFVALSSEEIAKKLKGGLPHMRTGKTRDVRNSDGFARRILYCLSRLAQQFPTELWLPGQVLVPAASKLPAVKLCDEPPLFHADIVRWGKIDSEARGRERGEHRAINDATRHRYPQDARTVLAAARDCRLMDESTSVRTLSSPEIAEPVFDYLDTLYGPSYVASMFAALTRITIELYGDDPSHQEAIRYLQAEAARRFPDQALSEAACKVYENLASDPLCMKTINDAPKEMMARAYEASLRPTDRVARAARAMVAQLKLECVALTATQAAELEVAVHLRMGENGLELRLPDPLNRGRFRWDPCTGTAEKLFAGWLALRDRYGICGSLVFPSDADPSQPQEAMAGLYADFEVVTRHYLTFDEIKILKCYKAIRLHPEKIRAIAEAAGYKDPRSLSRLMRVPLGRRTGKKAA